MHANLYFTKCMGNSGRWASLSHEDVHILLGLMGPADSRVSHSAPVALFVTSHPAAFKPCMFYSFWIPGT